MAGNVSESDIENILRREDVEGLIEAGAPDDEYNDEAKKVFAELQGLNDVSENAILVIITKVWGDCFDLDGEQLEKRELPLRTIAQGIFNLGTSK